MKVSIAQQGEYSFQFEELQNSPKVLPIKEILETSEEWDKVSLSGKAVHIGCKQQVEVVPMYACRQ